MKSLFLPRRSSVLRCVLVVALWSFGTLGCRPSKSLSFEAAGHSVSASIRGDHTLETAPERAVLQGAFGRVTFERSRVQVDDGQWVQIPVEAPIRLEASPGKVWIAAGNVTTARSR